MTLVKAQAMFNTETGEIKWYDLEGNALQVAAKITSKSTPKTSSNPSKIDDLHEFDLVVGEVNYRLSNRAIEALSLKPGDRLKWGLKWIDSDLRPIIAKPDYWGTTAGANLVSKNFTVQCKGQNRSDLIKLGTNFTLEKHEGFCILKGDTPTEQPKADPGIEIVKDNDPIINDLNKLGEDTQEEVIELTSEDLLKLLND